MQSLSQPSRIDLRCVSLAEVDRISAQRRLRPLSDSQTGIVDTTAIRLGLPMPPTLDERMAGIE